MPDTKISALTDGTAPADADAFPVARGAGNAKLTFAQLRAGIMAEKLSTSTTSGNITLALTNGSVQRVTLDAIRQITAPTDPGAVGASITLILNCAGFTPTWAGITWLTLDGLAPSLNTTAGKRNLIVLVWDDNNGGTGAWLGMLAGREV
jgi:hypothetical protein